MLRSWRLPQPRSAASTLLNRLINHRPRLLASSCRPHSSMAATSSARGGAAEPYCAAEHEFTNRLATEQSPYLLQHQHNPVDWYPWGQEAINKARKEDKPIFLSVGYSTCHWCHVMERESFEDHETADLLNRHFVAIKVDREERPDVDRVYMAYVQAVSGRGGWPMSVWLTPELEPIYGGTYYPKDDMLRGGHLIMPGFTTVLRRIASLWATNREDLKAKGTSIMSQLQQAMEGSSTPSSPAAGQSSEQAQSGEAPGHIQDEVAEHALTLCGEQLGKRFDARLGGFSGAPKFPRPSEINALLCAHAWHKSQGDEAAAEHALHMADFTLHNMAAGGMYDHIGGGFHRYSVDEWWHVPHFEKMTYDNPQLALAYLAAFTLTGDEQHASVARGVLDYLRRDMTHPQGGLYSAEDADSLNTEEGRKTEGFFYVWTHKEVQEVLGPQRAALFCEAYNIKPQGNCTLSQMSDPHEEFKGRNVPILLKPLEEIAQKAGMPLADLQSQLAESRQLLHKARQAKPRPSLDDKVVTAWNGMGISAYALAARVLKAEQPPAQPCFPVDGVPPATYMEAATAAAQFVERHLMDATTHTLTRSYRGAASNVMGFADDYAYLIAGLLDLYSAGGGLRWLQLAVQLQARMDSLFWDSQGGGYFSTAREADPHIKIRMKDSYDGAEPSASSVAAANLFRLAALLPDAPAMPASAAVSRTQATASDAASHQPQQSVLSYQERAEQTLAGFQEQLFEAPLAMPQMCCAAYLKLRAPLRQVILACSPQQAGGLSAEPAQSLLDAIHSVYAPDKAVHLIDLSHQEDVAWWEQHNKTALAMAEAHFSKQPGAAPSVFVCQDYTCQQPTSEPAKVVQLLQQSGSSRATPQPITGLPGMT